MVVPKAQDDWDIPKISISHGYKTNCNHVIYWIRNRVPSSPTEINNRWSPCTIIFKVFKIYRRGIRLVHVWRTLTDTIAVFAGCSTSYDNQCEKNFWPGMVLEVSVLSQRVPVNPALQVHLNCESSSCDVVQVPPFKQGESSQGSSAKGNIHAGVTSLRLTGVPS